MSASRNPPTKAKKMKIQMYLATPRIEASTAILEQTVDWTDGAAPLYTEKGSSPEPPNLPVAAT